LKDSSIVLFSIQLGLGGVPVFSIRPKPAEGSPLPTGGETGEGVRQMKYPFNLMYPLSPTLSQREREGRDTSRKFV